MKERLFPDSVYLAKKGETSDELEKRLWTAQRVGRFYCAPRCGYRCTWAAFQLATKRAKALCKLMGPGWEPRVWENGGWNYEVHKGTAQIYVHHDYKTDTARYSVWLQSEVASVTSMPSSFQVILDVPRTKSGTSDIHATLRKALKLKAQAAEMLLDEVAAVMA